MRNSEFFTFYQINVERAKVKYPKMNIRKVRGRAYRKDLIQFSGNFLFCQVNRHKLKSKVKIKKKAINPGIISRVKVCRDITTIQKAIIPRMIDAIDSFMPGSFRFLR